MMKRFPSRSLAAIAALVVSAVACAPGASVGSPSASATPSDNVRRIRNQGAPIGVQLWTFREQAKPDPLAMLKMARGMGISHVETAGLYGMTAAQLASALESAGLRATSMHVGYDDLMKNPQTVIANAKALGATYVGLAWYPHSGAFTEADARKAAADFNAIGKTMKDAGLTFFYHNHGYEPVPYGNGTLLDLLIQNTDPALVKFEMDVLWTWLPGADPVGLIRKYPGRFKLMHIKDMKPGIARGSLSGGLPAEQQAAIGQGQVDWQTLMAAAEKDGFQYYYLEDETTDPVKNVPPSITHLQGLRF
ncbi:MAG TPA: sugar phosphate isomerase/epimerase [Gemmatimonadaceae bacterium]|nr:sugar phosphate isomerase/epimerase [Gemmatimonadaceae bacterium]